jgi:ELP3 family radical SAM enzyme/protein acetyltransferase
MIDIEDIARKEQDKYGSFFQNIDKNIVNLVTDLCEMDLKNDYELKVKLRDLMRKYHVSPSKPQLCFTYDALVKHNIININPIVKRFIKAKEMRGLSGVIVISVITSPYPEFIDENGILQKQEFSCKHDCFYCPREVDANGKDINPRSYLSDEPTVARGLQNDFDAIRQFNDRAYQYVINSHYVDKLEIIVLGGTWTEYPRKYQETFIRDIFWAANTFYEIEKREKLTLEQEQKINETAKSRIIGVTLEMRPDSINEEEITWLRYLGCTRVQLGVQHTDRKILKKVNRGCYAEDAIKALKILKNYGYKVDAHWMPDLPGSSPEIDKKMFDYILSSQDLQFDQWKVYPTSVVPWTNIKKWFDEGKYIPYTDKNPDYLIDVLLYVKKRVHPWIRLNRVVRDIPNKTRDGELYIYGGNQKTNLRQILHNEMKTRGIFCPCIRCREVKGNTSMIDNSQIVVRKYNSSDGIEYFISVESGNGYKYNYKDGKWYDEWNLEKPGIIYGFLRLRICNNNDNNYFNEIKNSGLIRELHVYGQVVSKNSSENHINETQNKGFGKMLMNKAENIVMDHMCRKITVISGIGVKNYYKSIGYKDINTYMIKQIPLQNVIYYYTKKYINYIIILVSILFATHSRT